MPHTKENVSVPGMHVVLVGSPVEGFEVYGPFKTGTDACRWINTDPYLDAVDAWPVPLHAPETYADEEP